uniref:Uncharacterized protein n=1 Tax=Ciona savignyi TaxID=51511 RepID=H2Z5V4_CIOSA
CFYNPTALKCNERFNCPLPLFSRNKSSNYVLILWYHYDTVVLLHNNVNLCCYFNAVYYFHLWLSK